MLRWWVCISSTTYTTEIKEETIVKTEETIDIEDGRDNSEPLLTMEIKQMTDEVNFGADAEEIMETEKKDSLDLVRSTGEA